MEGTGVLTVSHLCAFARCATYINKKNWFDAASKRIKEKVVLLHQWGRMP
jgi:hypothetical protein